MTNQEVLQKVAMGYRMPQPANCPTQLYEIMLSCWKKNSQDRPTFHYLKDSLESFFDNDSDTQYKDTFLH